MTRLPMNRRNLLRTSGAALLGTGAVGASAATTQSSVATVEISPEEDLSILIGDFVLFSAQASDANGNFVELDDEAFNWDAGGGGIEGDGTFEPTEPGQYDVTASLEGVESEPTTVFVLEVDTVEIEPATDQDVLAGEPLDFSAEAFDANGNLIENVDGIFDWDAGGGNISTDGAFQETDPGEYSVTAALQGVTSEPTGVTVEPGDIDSVALDPADDQVLDAGNTLEFSAEALNAFGTVLEDDDTAFEFDAEGGDITNDGVFEETSPGEYDVTATIDGVVSEPTTVEVVTGPVQSVVIDPSGGQSVNPGEAIEFSAEAFDGDGFLVEDDDEAFGWDAEGGSIAADGTFEESAEGIYDVTATLDGTTSAPTTVFVSEDEVAEVLIEPDDDQVIEAGETVEFSAEAVNELGNILEDNDEEFTWNAEGGGGSIQPDGTFDDVATVDHEVTAAFAGVVSDPVTVTVESPLPPLPGAAGPPNDLNGTGLYEDVDGNGEFEIFDVQALFTNLDADAVQNNPEAYNFSGNDPEEVEIFDVQGLFFRLTDQ
jgi:hypothetical protein